jgi:hypothetical protein
MNFGYLLVVSSNENFNYLKMAYALALSIKNTQKPGFDKVALVIDDQTQIEKIKSPWVFDHIIEWNQETFWDGRSWMDKLSPWDSTICLDVDMLFLRDYSHWVEYFLENCDVYVPNKVFTYRGEVVTSDHYRRCFTRNDLPNLYSMFTFFKKDASLAKDFFALARHIIKNPKEYSNLYLNQHKPKIVGTDEAFALSAKILDIHDEISYDLDFPRLVHMKGGVQNWPWPAEKFTNHVGFYLNKQSQLKIGNYQQHDVVHYVEKDLITDEVINILEEIAWKLR